jgi:hypothetical protein
MQLVLESVTMTIFYDYDWYRTKSIFLNNYLDLDYGEFFLLNLIYSIQLSICQIQKRIC